MSATSITTTSSTASSSTATSTATSGTTSSTVARRRVPVAIVAVGAVLAGAVVTTVFELLVRAAGIELVAASNPSVEPEPIPVGGFFGGVVFWGFVGIVLAAALARFARTPRRTWTRATWTLTVLSLAAPMVVDAASIVTNLTLAASHLVAAAVIIPLVARRLDAVNARRA